MIKFKEQAILDSLKKVFPSISSHLVEKFLKYLTSPSEHLILCPYLKLNKPYGCNYVLEITEGFGFSFAQLNSGQSSSEHYHETRHEFFVVRKGELTLNKGGEKHLISQGEWNFSTPYEPHSIQNASFRKLEIIEVFSPSLLDDKIRIKDQYNRKIGKVFHQE